VASTPSYQRLLQHAQRIVALSSGDDILAASCRELVELTGAERVYASCALPRRSWEHGVHIETDHADTRPASRAACSALFALHRRAVTMARPFELPRDESVAAIFGGLACADSVTALRVVPIVHRTGRVWGELVVITPGPFDLALPGLVELAQLATTALENAERLSFARRDQDRLVLLAEATDDALYDWDFDTRDFWWGGGINHMLGSMADPVESSPRWKHDRIHPEDVERVRATFDRARFANDLRWEAEYRFRRGDNTYCHVEDRGYFLRDIDGRAYRTIGSMRDVTTVKQLLVREQEARSQAERASRAKDEFLAMLGHELRNPLAPIVTGLELLRMRGTIDIERDLPVMQRQAQHLIRLVDDLLDISRIAYGKIELKRERVEVATVVAAAVETATPLIVTRGHSIDLKVPAGLVVQADRARLAQAIANLVTNAAKYTEPGGKIVIAANRVGDQVAITVRDNGVGIGPDMLPHIFSMFVQERQSLDRSQGGLGLGLAIVRNLVELHGGTVEARSDGRGKGTEMTIRIPAVAVAEIARDPQDAVAEEPARGRRILVVDDNEDAADLLSAVLEELGNTTRVAHDASGALAIFDEFDPELAVLDIGLPVIDGYELARQLRDRRSAHPLGLIALTGYGQPSDKALASEAGFDAHLVKPVAISALQALIAKL
jgi:signal transduction histidine kinase